MVTYGLGPCVATLVSELPLKKPGVIAVPHEEISLQECQSLGQS